jgi:hypothetical protein
VEPHVAGLSGLRPEVSEEHGAVDMLCTVAREVTYVRGSIPADSLDCRRHVCCYLLAYRAWRPQCMEGALNPRAPIDIFTCTDWSQTCNPAQYCHCECGILGIAFLAARSSRTAKRSALTVDALRFYERQAGFPQSNILTRRALSIRLSSSYPLPTLFHQSALKKSGSHE